MDIGGTTSVIIRRANLFDGVRLVSLAKSFHSLLWDPSFFSVKKFLSVWQYSISRPEVSAWVAEKNYKIVGVIGISVDEPIAGGEVEASEVLWFVDNNERGNSFIGIKLLRMAESYCRENGIKKLRMTSLVESNGESVGNYLIKTGYYAKEIHYEKIISSN